ncbi:MAG: bifunctional folylpolyglutamate synthase/dihydrofolate synthase [Rubripirellula sp.]|nr:bifunctional folylpolyglutamate synthase/dihydrofolate synthase [Rubripirellula sp.]
MPCSADPYQRSLEFLYDRLNYERQVRGAEKYPFGLRRITELLRRLGLGRYLYQPGVDPEVPLIHVAGTKGKGSTATMVANVLAAAGVRTGLYSSPHLHCLEERFRVNGQPCTADEMVTLVDRVRPSAMEVGESDGPPSFFELTTAMAFLHFENRGCDAIVVEVGLGGRLDSTNVCSPSVTAVTSIGFDHQQVLGNSLEEIAGEKAGIIKPGIPVVSGVTQSQAARVIAERAEAVNAPLFQIGEHFDWEHVPNQTWGSRVTVAGRCNPLSDCRQFELAMDGVHQAKNASIATVLLDLLRQQGLAIDDAALANGMANSQCAGRIEHWQLSDDRLAIIDSAHNEDSVAALCQTLEHRCSGRPITMVFGTSIDKTAEPMLKRLAEVSSQLVLTRFLGNPRFRDPKLLMPLVPPRFTARTTVIDDPIRACESALAGTSPGGVLVVCGSFFLAAECRQWVQDQVACRSR